MTRTQATGMKLDAHTQAWMERTWSAEDMAQVYRRLQHATDTTGKRLRRAFAAAIANRVSATSNHPAADIGG